MIQISKFLGLKKVCRRVGGKFFYEVRRWAGAALAVALLSPALGADEGMSLNLGSEKVSQTWSLGEYRARLELTLARTARVWLADKRVWISLNAGNPELTRKLQASLHSTAKSGYTLLVRSGSTEISLGAARNISLSTDVQRAVWIHATLRLQQRTAGVTTAGERRFTGRLEPSVIGRALVFTVKALEIEGVSAAVNRSIAQEFPPMRVELPDCVEGLRFENIHFTEKENAVTVTASVSGTNLFSIIPCLAGLE